MRFFICAALLIVLAFAAPDGKLDCGYAEEKGFCEKFAGCQWAVDRNSWDDDDGECQSKFPVIDLGQDKPCTGEGYIQINEDGCRSAADQSNSKFHLVDTSSMTDAGRQHFVIPFGCSVSKGIYSWRPSDGTSYARWEFAKKDWKRVCRGNYPDDYCKRFTDCESCRAFEGNDDFWNRCEYSNEQGCASEYDPDLTYERHCPGSEQKVAQATDGVENARLKRINEALLEALKTMAN